MFLLEKAQKRWETNTNWELKQGVLIISLKKKVRKLVKNEKFKMFFAQRWVWSTTLDT